MAILRDRLEALRSKLLDLSFRNRLLNHSDTGRRMLKVRRLSLAELYKVLVDEGRTLTISPAPIDAPAPLMATSEGASERTPESASESVPELAGEPTPEPASKPATEPFEDIGKDFTSELLTRRLPVAMRASQLENSLRIIHSQRKAMMDSTGSNLLYLALGFLEWHDPHNGVGDSTPLCETLEAKADRPGMGDSPKTRAGIPRSRR